MIKSPLSGTCFRKSPVKPESFPHTCQGPALQGAPSLLRRTLQGACPTAREKQGPSGVSGHLLGPLFPTWPGERSSGQPREEGGVCSRQQELVLVVGVNPAPSGRRGRGRGVTSRLPPGCYTRGSRSHCQGEACLTHTAPDLTDRWMRAGGCGNPGDSLGTHPVTQLELGPGKPAVGSRWAGARGAPSPPACWAQSGRSLSALGPGDAGVPSAPCETNAHKLTYPLNDP